LQLVAFKPSERLAAKAALAHPFLAGSSAAVSTLRTVESVGTAVTRVAEGVTTAVEDVLPGSLLEEAFTHSMDGALTEAQLAQEFGYSKRGGAPARKSSQTIAWFEDRENEVQRRLEERRRSGSPSGSQKVAVAQRSGRNGSGSGKAPTPNHGNGNGNGQSGVRPKSPVALNGKSSDDSLEGMKERATDKLRELVNVFGGSGRK